MNLQDATLVLTRPAQASARFAKQVETTIGVPGKLVISPAIEIESLPFELILDEESALIFTSENGLAAYLNDFAAENRTAWCVGPHTAKLAREAGFQTEVADGTVETLIRLIANHPGSSDFVHITGRHRRGNLAERLTALGKQCCTITAYDQREQTLSEPALRALASDDAVILPIFSPRTASILSAQIDGTRPNLGVVCMSEAVLNAWNTPMPKMVTVAENPISEGMLAALRQCLALLEA